MWLNELEQYGGRECLKFRGMIPVTADEDTTKLVCQVASLVGAKVLAADVSTSHQIQPKMNTSKFPPSIIAKSVWCGKLRDHSTRDLNNLGRLAENKIYISESLRVL